MNNSSIFIKCSQNLGQKKKTSDTPSSFSLLLISATQDPALLEFTRQCEQSKAMCLTSAATPHCSVLCSNAAVTA